MRHGLTVSIAYLAITACSLFCFGAGNGDYDPQKVIVIPYTEFSGRPVELVFDGNFKSITLRARLADYPPPDKSPEMEFLKNEVKRLVDAKKASLGNSGYELIFKSGYPTWEPMSISDPPSECLTFATGSLDEKIITARGAKKKAVNYPYPE